MDVKRIDQLPAASTPQGTDLLALYQSDGTKKVKLEDIQTSGPAGPAGPAGAAGKDGENGKDGAPGAPGKDGAAAGFGEVTATVDGGVGMPSVKVTTSGPDTQKAFAFEFHNLKGEPGEAGSGGGSYTLPVASADTLGGVRAKAKTDAETVEVAVDADGKLYVPAASGGGEGYTLPVAGQELGGVKRNAMQTKDIDQMQGVFAQALSSPVLIAQDGVMMVPFVGSNIGRENGTHNFGVVSSNGAKTDEDIVPVHVDGNGKLWVKPSGEGGGVTMEQVEAYVNEQLGVIENGAY